MSSFQTEERSKLRKHWVDQAIALAMQNKWDEAVKVNQSILELFPNDVDSYNRLGRAQTELGRYGEARAAYQRTLELDATNSIAKKNLARLSSVKEETPPPPTQRVDPRMFIAEAGKTGVVTLMRAAPRDSLARLSAGDELALRPDGNVLTVCTTGGEYLGQVEPKIGLRLLELMRSGNKYVAAVMGLEDANLRVVIRETVQHPANIGKVSFPTRSEGPAVRPYIKETLVKYELEDEEDEDGDGEESDIGLEHDLEETDEPADHTDFDEDHATE